MMHILYCESESIIIIIFMTFNMKKKLGILLWIRGVRLTPERAEGGQVFVPTNQAHTHRLTNQCVLLRTPD